MFALEDAVRREGHRRYASFLDGVETYRRHGYRRTLPTPDIIWTEGATRLFEHGAGGARSKGRQPGGAITGRTLGRGRPVLIVPSLINRSYVLDLTSRNSLCRWLAAEGFHVYRLDWGEPGELETLYTLGDYIAGPLERAAEWVTERHGAPPVVLGYCMGGLLALALADRRPDLVERLGLLATPWDFHAGGKASALAVAAAYRSLEPWVRWYGAMPVDMIQALFAAIDPISVPMKFRRFGELDQRSRKARLFVAVEDWLNDGVPLAASVAGETLHGWYGENRTMTGKWVCAGRRVLPESVTRPSIALIPASDRIVPPRSAEALARRIPDCSLIRAPLGHIGMIVADGAPARVWRPLAEWMARIAE